MSWMKRAQRETGAGVGPQPYVAGQAQPFANQPNMYSNYPGGSESTPPQGSQQPQYWQAPPPLQQPPAQQQQYNQQYAQVYQQDYTQPHNSNQLYQQPTNYNHNYTGQGFPNPQQNYQQNYYQNQPQQQNYLQNTTNNDSWEDNWDWGWEESAKQAQKAQQAAQQRPVQQQVLNNASNANVIEESFAPTNTWNWAMDDKKVSQEPAATLPTQEIIAQVHEPSNHTENQRTPEPNPLNSVNNIDPASADEVKNLSDRDVVKERMPNLALGKRFHLDNLTPQWSIESQMSQESSDGPPTHSESTYRSENHSGNSNSPAPNTDNSNYNYSQSGLDDGYTQNSEWTRQSDGLTLTDSIQSGSRNESHNELSNSMQELTLANYEKPASENMELNEIKESRNFHQQPPLTVSPVNLPPPMSTNHPGPTTVSMPPPPPVLTAMLPPPATVTPPAHPSLVSLHQVSNRPPSANLPPASLPLAAAAEIAPSAPLSNLQPVPPSSSASLPPLNFPPPSNSQIPFKHAGPFAHKASSSLAPIQPFPPQMSNANLSSPAAVSKASQQNRTPVGFEANLETTPDNSERPDHPQGSGFTPTPVPLHVPDNMEVAPQNDRNEYLQTAHLSSGEYGENTDFTRNAPPPGLRRMVVGQQETEYGQSSNLPADEPPPGLSRMVPGQQTEGDGGYESRPGDDYLERLIDGRPTESGGRPYRQAEGQRAPDEYSQSANGPRRPIGLNRMVPGEPSNDDYSQYQSSNFSTGNEQRVVTGLDRDYTARPNAAGPSDVREQNVDGSDAPLEFRASADDREGIMEGENLQDLSVVSSVELSHSRDQTLEGAEPTDAEAAASAAVQRRDSGSPERPATGSRRVSPSRRSSEDTDRDRAFDASPRRDRHKPSRDRDRERDRDRDRDKEEWYSRGERKHGRDDRKEARDDRRSDKERRERRERDRDRGPDARRQRRSTRSHRYETEDTDHYSDQDRDRRRHRDGPYSSKPPVPRDERSPERRYEERSGRSRRYGAERTYRDIDPRRTLPSRRRDRDREDDERRRVTFSRDAKASDSSRSEGDPYSSPSRAASREATGTDEDASELRRRDRDRRSRRSARRTVDPYYDTAEVSPYAEQYSEQYLSQRQQYEYYERLRLADPVAYMHVYKRLMAQPSHYIHPAPLARGQHDLEGMGGAGCGTRGEERGSVHSGRSSTAGYKGNDTYYVFRRDRDCDRDGSLRDAPSLRTDISDRDLTTEMSLPTNLETSTVRSDRMTPPLYSTAHAKGRVGSGAVVVVRGAYPVDGRPATLHLLSLRHALGADPAARELAHSPGPLVKGITHKKSVIEYCAVRVRSAEREAPRDAIGYVLLWELLALLLTQNGVVVGSDIAELLMKNTRQYEYKSKTNKSTHNGSRPDSSVSVSPGGSSVSGAGPRARADEPAAFSHADMPSEGGAGAAGGDEAAALDKLREFLIYGNRQEALEWAMAAGLWGHALQLAAHGERRQRALVAARFVAAVPRRDPLHTLYAALAHQRPPVATSAGEEGWGEWRTHAAILLANPPARPDLHTATLTQLGDSLASRGLPYSAQFCYVSGGVPFSRHPLAPLHSAPAPTAPPRLSLLLAEGRAGSLAELATNHAILATEIYEYALSLSQDYVIPELQVYKFVLACRLVDAGLPERALGYLEQAARALSAAPHLYPRALLAALASLADRLKYHDPALQTDPPLVEDGVDSEGSPTAPPHHQHQQWLLDVTRLAHPLTEAHSHQSTPQHQQVDYYAHQQQQQQLQPLPQQQHQYSWEQVHQYQQQQQQQEQHQSSPNQYVEPEETPDYSQQYYQPVPVPPIVGEPEPAPAPAPAPVSPQHAYSDWSRTEEHHAQAYADVDADADVDSTYWRGDTAYGYGETVGNGAGLEANPRPMITMPGTAPNSASNQLYSHYEDDRPPSADQQSERDTDTPKTSKKQEGKKEDQSRGEGRGKGGGWLGGILTKLSLRPPNQMILPDDKNPTIVWDADKKRWKNLDGEDAESERPPPPPPRDTPLLPNTSTPTPSPSAPMGGAPPAATAGPVSNIFKMQKGRHIKKSYVDVFNPSGAATRPLPPAADVLGPAPALAPHPAYFVPSPAHAQRSQEGDLLPNGH